MSIKETYVWYQWKVSNVSFYFLSDSMFSSLYRFLSALWSVTHPWDVGNNFKGDSTAWDGAAMRHSLQEALGKTLAHKWPTSAQHMSRRDSKPSTHHTFGATHLSPSDVDTDALPEDQLHVSRVAQLHHHAHRQVDSLLSGCHATQLGALMDCWVPGSLHLHLHHMDKEKNDCKHSRHFCLLFSVPSVGSYLHILLNYPQPELTGLQIWAFLPLDHSV